MICKCCGEVRADWGNKRYCRECWEELNNEKKDYREEYLDNLGDMVGEDENGNTFLTRKNGSGAVVKGVNLEAKVIPSSKLNLQAGFTIQQSLYKEAQTWSENTNLAPNRQMFRAPDNYGYLTLNYLPVKSLTFSLNSIYTGSMLMQHYGAGTFDDKEVLTPTFFDIGGKIAYSIPLSSGTKLQLNGGFQNILNSFQKDFDTGITRDAGYVYGPSLPRSYFIGIKFTM
jgi:outer membrane receptor for ferrienterochelin and colicins